MLMLWVFFLPLLVFHLVCLLLLYVKLCLLQMLKPTMVCFVLVFLNKSEKQRHGESKSCAVEECRATTNPCCACCVPAGAWETGEEQNEDEDKPNLLASGVIKCYLSFLQYLHWQCFIRDLWPSVLQIYCIRCGFCNLKLLWN